MDPDRKQELKRQAFMRLAAQRRRAGLLRGRVVVLSLICFALLWGIVFVQMATGNDPVLSAKKVVATRATANTTTRSERRATATRKAEARREEGGAAEEEFVAEEPEEPEAAEGAAVEEAATEPEAVEAAPVEEPEVVETEPLVTSQS